MTIVEFLTARLDEDEARFEAAVEAEAESCRRDGIPDMTAQEVKDYWLRRPVETQWPRYLAEIAAKRQIVRELSVVTTFNWPSQPGGTVPPEYVEALRRVLRVLAAIYAGHPDYRQEWKP